MVVAGRAVTITGGHLHWFGGEADGLDGLRHAVRQLVKEGADFIKIMASGGSTRSSHPYLPAFTPGELQAIVDEARRHERLTAAHAVPSAAIEDCLDAGLDMIIHCSMTERHRRLRVPPGPGGPDGRSRRLGQPDDARHPRLALALPRRGGGGPPRWMPPTSRSGTSSGSCMTTSSMPCAGSTPPACG